MISHDAYYAGIFEEARDGALILSVNKRLARHLRQLFDRRMMAEGAGAWRSPEILSLDEWLHRCVDGLGLKDRTLSLFQARLIWEALIEENLQPGSGGLLQVPSTAQLALEAHSLLVEYGVDLDDFPLTEDHEVFLQWRQCYENKLSDTAWIDPSRIPTRVCEGIREGLIAVPSRVILVGFDEIPPRLKELKTALAQLDCAVADRCAPSASVTQAVRKNCADLRDEVRSAARWARGLLEQGKENIGVVVADLGRYRGCIEQIFREEIAPASLAELEPAGKTINLSLGASLGDQGLICAAFQILELGRILTLEQASFLLRTPFIQGSGTERTARALLDPSLRARRRKKLTIDALIELCKKGHRGTGEYSLPQLGKILETHVKNSGTKGRHSPGEWAVRLSGVLEIFGWPGESPIDSDGYQVIKAWREKILSPLVTFNTLLPALDASEALGLVKRLAAETLFQPEGQGGTFQVLGLLEASGMNFDYLWVMGLASESFPAQVRPNPFLPPKLQSHFQMPRANPDKELVFAQDILGRLCAAAPEVILSYPRFEGDCPLRPSPLILEAGDMQSDPGETVSHCFLPAAEGFFLETLRDANAPGLREKEQAKGGTSILKDQAICPFRAFAHHRLRARGFDESDIGLDALSRGNLIHGVLERFWHITRDSQALARLTPEELCTRVESCVDQTLSAFCQRPGEDLPEPLIRIERTRLLHLACEWLDGVERQRTPFSVVEIEEDLTLSFGGVSIKTKVDRMDVIVEGKQVVIDYKTGSPGVDDLLGERILEPQLPIYGSSITAENLDGVAFGILKKGECAFKGVARHGEIFPRIEAFEGSRAAQKFNFSDWTELLEVWDQRLHNLGREFATGEASVRPYDPLKACRLCDLGPLCRIEDVQDVEEVE